MLLEHGVHFERGFGRLLQSTTVIHLASLDVHQPDRYPGQPDCRSVVDTLSQAELEHSRSQL